MSRIVRSIEENGFHVLGEFDLYENNQRIYNKAIDDFIHECDKSCGFYTGDNKNLTREDLLMIADELKEMNK